MVTASRLRNIPWLIVVCCLTLLVLGLGGIARGDELRGGPPWYGRQLVWIGMALPVMALVNWLDYRELARFAGLVFGFCLSLLCIVFLFRPINGAHRWIPLGFMNLQPSEITKLGYILALASYLRFRENYRTWSGLVVPFLMTLVPMVLVFKEPNLGTTLLFLPVLFAMLFAAGARPRHLLAVALLGICVLPVLWLGMSAEQRSRVTALFNQQDGGPAPPGDNYHLHQSKQVLTLGGVWGSQISGDRVDDPDAYHLPEGRTDFIFCMIGERWGLWGCGVTLLVYAVLFGRGLLVAACTRDPFGRLLAVGIVTLFATQTIINTGMTVGLVPITGITLPLLSHGGSSLLTTCAAFGLLLNIGSHRSYDLRGEPFRFTT